MGQGITGGFCSFFQYWNAFNHWRDTGHFQPRELGVSGSLFICRWRLRRTGFYGFSRVNSHDFGSGHRCHFCRHYQLAGSRRKHHRHGAMGHIANGSGDRGPHPLGFWLVASRALAGPRQLACLSGHHTLDRWALNILIQQKMHLACRGPAV